jgi:hypothetical protein
MPGAFRAGLKGEHMKYLKMLGLAALSAMALMAVTAGAASATTLEVGGVTQNSSVAIEATIKAGTSAVLRDTAGFSQNTCTTSVVSGNTSSPYTGATVTGAINALSFSNCAREPVTVHKAGTLHIAHIAETTNGTVTSSGAEVTTPSPFGTLNCVTGSGTHLGTLTGSASGHASLTINAVLSCSGVSSRWTGTYTVTSPTGLVTV